VITTHVLDTTRGCPAAGVSVALAVSVGPNEWRSVGRGETDSDGRLRNLVQDGSVLAPGLYRLMFDTGRYFDAQGVRSFYPYVVIVFQAAPDERHYHVPLLLGPFGYTTYRGS
jgi:5-hydroxyisourate hydrolase